MTMKIIFFTLCLSCTRMSFPQAPQADRRHCYLKSTVERQFAQAEVYNQCMLAKGHEPGDEEYRARVVK